MPTNPLTVDLAGRALAQPLTFAAFMDAALNDPDHGYYARGVKIGGEGADFFTAPSLPGFASSLARGITACWERLGKPDPFTVVELGAGTGELAVALRAALADVPVAYVTVEPNGGMAEQQRARGLTVAPNLAALPPLENAFVLANEVLDALPVHRVRRDHDGLVELFVAWSQTDGFHEVAGPLSNASFAELVGDDLPVGHVAEVCPAAGVLLRALATRLSSAYVAFVDYGDERPDIFSADRAGGTARGFKEHRIASDVYAEPGSQDITASVDFTLMQRFATDAGFTVAGVATQGRVLAALGILGDHQKLAQDDPLAALKAKTLFVPGGMGDAFKVMLLARDAPVDGLPWFEAPW